MENIKDVDTENVVTHKTSAKKKRHSLLNEAVQVVVRCRPMSTKEKFNNNFNVVTMYPAYGIVEITNPKEIDLYPEQKTFTFDVVYDVNSTQDDIYNTSIRSLVQSVLEGFNGCVFAYGQTGTGKTYTMEGSKDNKGIIPKTFEQIWDYINCTSNMQFLVSVSYLEIYLEEIRDLLKRDHTSKLEIREYCGRGIVIPNLHTVTCKTADEMAQVMAIGNRNRTVANTKMNDRSSRSHAIFSVTIEMCNTDQEYENVRVGKLNLIDLAGSERQSKTGACSDRLKEASKINRALSALGNVISALAENSSHIPYRDSKLTRLLQNSLGGNSKTVMIANIGPSNYNYEESLTTLRYAHRAKAIKNTLFKNEDPKDAKLREYREEIQRLKELIEQRRLEEKQVIVIHKVIKVNKNSTRHKEQITNSDLYTPDESSDAETGGDVDLEEEIDEEEDAEFLERLYLERQKTDELTMRLEELESQLVNGGHALEKIDINEQKLAEQLIKLEEQKTRETEIKYVLEQESDTKIELHEAYSSLQQESDIKSQKIDEITALIEVLQKQIVEMREKTNEEQREIEVQTEELNKELKLKALIIENFIPYEARRDTINKINFDTNTDSWVLSPETYERRTCRPLARPEYDRPYTKYALSEMKSISCPFRFKSENIVNFELELPEKTTVKYQPSSVPSTFRQIINVAMCQEDDIINIDVQGADYSLGTDSARTQAQMETIARNLAMKKETQRGVQARSAKHIKFVKPSCSTPSVIYNKLSKK